MIYTYPAEDDGQRHADIVVKAAVIHSMASAREAEARVHRAMAVRRRGCSGCLETLDGAVRRDGYKWAAIGRPSRSWARAGVPDSAADTHRAQQGARARSQRASIDS
jgi:hypothetical protein